MTPFRRRTLLPVLTAEDLAALRPDRLQSRNRRVRGPLSALARALEDYDHTLTIARWARLLLAVARREYRHRPAPPPATVHDRRQRVELLRQRRAAGLGLFSPGDVLTLSRPWHQQTPRSECMRGKRGRRYAGGHRRIMKRAGMVPARSAPPADAGKPA